MAEGRRRLLRQVRLPAAAAATTVHECETRQNRLAKSRHTGAVQDRSGQTQGVQFPQDPVLARVQAQAVPDRRVLQVPVDIEAHEARQADDDTHIAGHVYADDVVARLAHGHRRPAVVAQPHYRLFDAARVRAGRFSRHPQAHRIGRSQHRGRQDQRQRRRRIVVAQTGRAIHAGPPPPPLERDRRVPERVGLGKMCGAHRVPRDGRRTHRYTAGVDQLVSNEYY